MKNEDGAGERERELWARAGHEFWSDTVLALEEERFDWTRVSGRSQITDVYLLALALEHEGRLVTFDRSIAWQAVRGAKRSDVILLGR